ncbi:LysR substrate-binding domain-containing protein [uncultured Cohaesibacter sp.]|uniref:LysR family transcriptional regulator n=1 Tax=uncultured Cohaesibacter sp. TaxID=1002546 RepID=UPI0029C94284|nr:LysR substrate-binding domain-containing protein [uncultured Cohaesibacter sp.]
MKQTLRLRQLEALMAVASLGSMTAAATELGVSQPAVSRLLADLAKELGFSLFDRREGQIVPSQEVRFLLPNIRQVLELMQQISDVSQEITQRKAGHIRVACLPGFATSHLPEVVKDFLSERPGVSMTIEPDRPERILEWMIGEHYDFGITDNFSGHPALESRSIDIRTVCIFPAGHRLVALDRISPADLSGEKIIHSRRDSDFFGKLSASFLSAQCHPQFLYRDPTVLPRPVSLSVVVSASRLSASWMLCSFRERGFGLSPLHASHSPRPVTGPPRVGPALHDHAGVHGKLLEQPPALSADALTRDCLQNRGPSCLRSGASQSN